jgi:hypothetical protein
MATMSSQHIDDISKILADHSEWMADPKTGARANLARANLEGADLAGAALACANLARANLAGANLEEANLARANLEGANLAGAYLEGAYLARANLEGANLDGADLEGANLDGANLARVNLARANLAGADLDGAIGFRYPDAPDPVALRLAVADHIESHPELHNQAAWGSGEADPACGTPCCVAGWACHLGGGARGDVVASAAVRLLWVEGLPMPSFEADASRNSILAALRAEPA